MQFNLLELDQNTLGNGEKLWRFDDLINRVAPEVLP